MPHAIGKRHSQIGAKGAHALGDPGIVGANANRPSADRFLDFSAVVEDFPVHAAMLAYLRRCVQLETTSVGLAADWGASCTALQATGRLGGAGARRTRSRASVVSGVGLSEASA